MTITVKLPIDFSYKLEVYDIPEFLDTKEKQQDYFKHILVKAMVAKLDNKGYITYD